MNLKFISVKKQLLMRYEKQILKRNISVNEKIVSHAATQIFVNRTSPWNNNKIKKL